MPLGLLEYALVGVGFASLIAKARERVFPGARMALVALFIYMSAQFSAHLLLNLQSVNLRLLANADPAVSIAAASRIVTPVTQARFLRSSRNWSRTSTATVASKPACSTR